MEHQIEAGLPHFYYWKTSFLYSLNELLDSDHKIEAADQIEL